MSIVEKIKQTLFRSHYNDSKREVIEKIRSEKIPVIERRMEMLGLDGQNVRREEQRYKRDG